MLAFCGIGRPGSFFGMLEGMGAVLDERMVFPDHYKYSDDDIERIDNERASRGVDAVVTTEKDLVRLADGARVSKLYVLGIRLEIEKYEQFAKDVSDRINISN